MKIACLQMEIKKADPAANLAVVAEAAPRAAAQGVRILLLPELWSTGFAYHELPRLAADTPGILAEVGRLASGHGLVIAGSLPELDKGKLFNTLYVVERENAVRASYRKAHLFPLFKEEQFLAPGNHLVSFNLLETNIGLSVCFDLRFPETFRKLALKGAKLILVSAQWPRERLEQWLTLVKARAIENQVYLAAANCIGRHGRTVFAGHSLIVDPAGSVLAEGAEGPELVTAEADPTCVDKIRREINYLACRVKDVDEFLTLN